MKQSDWPTVERESWKGPERDVSDFIWETFDSLFKTVHRQGRRMEELEARVVDLESHLTERHIQHQPKAAQSSQPSPPILNEMPAERAA